MGKSVSIQNLPRWKDGAHERAIRMEAETGF